MDLIDEWKKDFKGYIDELDIPRDDYNGIMEYIDEVQSAQPETHEEHTETHACDLIERRAAIDVFEDTTFTKNEIRRRLSELPSTQPLVIHCTDCEDWHERQSILGFAISELPSVQSEIIQCKDCKFSHMTINGECKYCDIWFPDEKCYMSGDYYCGSAERREE